MLRYFSESMFRKMETKPAYYMWNPSNASVPDKFQRDVLNILQRNLQGQAASGGSRWKVAYGTTATENFETIFALVQCTPDLSSENCSSCLINATLATVHYCNVKSGCRAYMPSCNIRYELYPFYNDIRLQELDAAVTEATPILPSPSPSPSPSPPVVQEINANTESLQYDFGKIKAATCDFSEAKKLGRGVFGNVYKGILPDGQELAVKRLSWDSRQGDGEFKNEVLLMARLQHRNLVRLLGFSIQGKEKLLVYDFVKNASLDRFIFDPVKRSDLGWDQCDKIIMGIAKGLVYLHEESRLKIIHRDLKVSNVLLDGDMNPKITDFGLARLFLSDESEGNTSKIVGTYGYMAPEYAMHGEFSVKFDVFSFGVLVLEIIRGQRNNSIRNGENVEYLSSLAWKHWCKGTIADLIDPLLLRPSSGTLNDMLRCIHIGLLCVQENPAYRPTMAAVVQMISNSNFSLPVPSQPAFFVPVSHDLDNAVILRECTSNDFESSKSYSNNKPDDQRPTHSSKNGLSVTELYPR